MQPAFYELIREPGFLATMARPAGESLFDEIDALRAAGVGVVVSLLPDEEAHALGLRREGDVCQALGLEFISLPVRDFGIPDDARAIVSLAKRLRQRMREGHGVVIHCRAGIGRSSTVAAAVLLRDGRSPQEAFALISRARGVQCPETPAQAAWVTDNAQLMMPDAS